MYKENLINSLMKDDYIKYKNCYIARSKLLYDSSETLIKEISALSQLNDLGYEIYLLPYSYARDSMNFYKKSADSITYGDFLELKSTISTNERAGQNCYEAGRKQADNIYISFVNDISEENALKSIYGSIGNIKKGNRKNNIEDNFKGLLFLNFEKKGEIYLYDISKEGYVTKLENASFENLKKILEANKNSQVIVDPSNKRRSPRNLNLQQIDEHVNNENIQNISPSDYLTQKINASGINVHLSKEEMKVILEAGKDVQKLAVKYGTNQKIEEENENTFNGYGTYVVSVNEENAKQLGITDRNCHFGFFADLRRNSAFTPNYNCFPSPNN